MAKKLFLLIAVLGVAGGGFFYWWNNQADVRELNKGLPEGVRVVKSLFGEKYKVVNKIDGYEFKVPMEWEGLGEVTYISEREEVGYVGTSLNIEGLKGEGVSMAIDRFIVNSSPDLMEWSQNMFDVFGLTGEFSSENVDDIEVIKTKENVHLWGDYVYFFKGDGVVYTITGSIEKFIKYIITNGKW